MRYLTIQRQDYITIAWFLTGLMVTCSLLSACPNITNSAVCAEERALEKDDDDRSNSIQLDVALHYQVDERPTSQTWQEVRVFYCVQMIAALPTANLQRGPPGL